MEPAAPESLSIDILTHEVSKYLPIQTLRKLCHTCKNIRSQVFRHSIREFTLDSEISLKFVYENRHELSLRSLSVQSLPSVGSSPVVGSLPSSVDVFIAILESQTRLQDLKLHVNVSYQNKLSRHLHTLAAAAPPCNSLTSLFVRGSFAEVFKVSHIAEKYLNIEKLVFIENSYSPPDIEASLLAKFSKLRYLQLSTTKAEIIPKYKTLSHLTTLITNVPWNPIKNHPNTLAAISSMKDLAPEGVGVNLIFAGPMCLLWDLIQTRQFEEVSSLRAVLDAGARLSLEYMDEKVNPILCHLVFHRSDSPTFFEWLQVLLDAGADPTVPGKGGLNALLSIFNTNSPLDRIKEFYKRCLDKWRDRASFFRLFCSYPEGLSIFHTLSMTTAIGEESRLAYFVSKEGLELLGNPSVDVLDPHGRTAAVAAYSGEALDILLKAGANPNVTTKHGISLLSYKAASGPTKSVAILLKHPDLILPPPIPETPFQDVLESTYVLNVQEKFLQLVALSHSSHLFKLMDRIAKDLRHAAYQQASSWRIREILGAFTTVASAAVERRKLEAEVYRDSAVYLWDMLECKLKEEMYLNLIEVLLQTGAPLSWPRPPARSARKKSNVIIRACELKAFSALPIIINACSDLLFDEDHTGTSTIDYVTNLLSLAPEEDAERIRMTLQPFDSSDSSDDSFEQN